MPKPTLNLDPTEDTSTTPSVYTVLLPLSSLFPGLNVRPGETPAEHEQRVADLARQLREDGQKVPIVVRPIVEGGYSVIDGQGRFDALQRLDAEFALCTIDDSLDPWATAVKLNVQRHNYSDLQLATLIAEARERYGWKQKGGGRKCAEFFGITEPLLVEYNTLADAPQDVKERLQSGEITKSAALKLIASTAGMNEPLKSRERRAEVMHRAAEIAAKDKKKGKDSPAKAAKSTTTAPAPEPKAVKAVKVQAQHIVEASRQVAAAANETAPIVKRNRTELLAAITQLIDFSPSSSAPRMVAGLAFLRAYLKFADGLLPPKQLQVRWNDAIGFVPPAKGKSKAKKKK